MANVLKQFLVFLLGFFIGVIIAVIYNDLSNSPKRVRSSKTIPIISDKILYEFAFRRSGFKRRHLNPDDVSFETDKKNYFTEAEFLYRNVSIICIVFIETGSNADAYHVANTWGNKCNRLIFFGERSNHYLKVKRVKSVHSWRYLCESIKYIWANYKNELQWALFSPDKVFIIPENLRYVLAPKDYMKPFYIGHKVMFWNQIYNSRSAGYVLSYKAIEMLMNKFANSCSSSKYSNNEDYYLGMYLEEVGVKATDAIDDRGRERFHLFTPAQLIAPGSESVLQKYNKHSLSSVTQGFNCCSASTISFQGSSKDSSYLINYLLYNVKLFSSGNKGNKKSASYTPMNEVWKTFVADQLGDVNPDLISKEDYYKLWMLKVESPRQFNEKLKKQFLSSS